MEGLDGWLEELLVLGVLRLLLEELLVLGVLLLGSNSLSVGVN